MIFREVKKLSPEAEVKEFSDDDEVSKNFEQLMKETNKNEKANKE